MSQEILVIGGTRYFGIRLVEALLAAGDHVTIATRGRTPDPFGHGVRCIAVDRGDAATLQTAFREACFELCSVASHGHRPRRITGLAFWSGRRLARRLD